MIRVVRYHPIVSCWVYCGSFDSIFFKMTFPFALLPFYQLSRCTFFFLIFDLPKNPLLDWSFLFWGQLHAVKSLQLQADISNILQMLSWNVANFVLKFSVSLRLTLFFKSA